MAKAKGIAIRRDDTRRMEEEAKQMEAKLELLRRTMDVAEQSGRGADTGRWRGGASSKPLTKGYIKSVLEADAAKAPKPAKQRTSPSPKSPAEAVPSEGPLLGFEEASSTPMSKLLASSPSNEFTSQSTQKVGGKAAANLQAAMNQQNKEALEVEAFLCSLKLDRYVGLFLEHGFDCMEVVKEMQEQHMQQIGMAAGHVLKLRKRLSEMTPSKASAQGSSGSSRKVAFDPEAPPRQSLEKKVEDDGGPPAPGSLFEGAFDEEESAASFQEALKAWRGEPKEPKEPRPVPQAAPGSFWSRLGDSEVNLERASTPLKPPAETTSTETQGSLSPSSDEKICCYQCFKQFYSRYAVERECPPDLGGGLKRLCSEACADAWVSATKAKLEAAQKRQMQLEQMQEMQRALDAEAEAASPAGGPAS